MRRSFATSTAVSKSAFSSAPNKSSKEALALRFRLCFAGAVVRRALRTGAAVCTGSADVPLAVLRVFRTGLSSGTDVTAVRRVLRAGVVGMDSDGCGVVVGRELGPDSRGVRDGPLGPDFTGGPDLTGGPDPEDPTGGPRLRPGGP